MANELSAYEKLRLENIRKNEEFLKSLGLCLEPKPKAFTARTVEDFSSKRGKRKPKKSSVENDDTASAGYVSNKRKYVSQSDDGAGREITTRRITRSQRSSTNEAYDDNEKLIGMGNVENDRGNPSKKSSFNSSVQSYIADGYISDGIGDSGDCDLVQQNEHSERKLLTSEELRSFVESHNPEHNELISDEVNSTGTGLFCLIEIIYPVLLFTFMNILTRLRDCRLYGIACIAVLTCPRRPLRRA